MKTLKDNQVFGRRCYLKLFEVTASERGYTRDAFLAFQDF